jgi:hypothetical protein
VVLLIVAGFAAVTARVFIWPHLPPVPAHADAIIELAGPGNRDAVTMALARRHIAPLVIQSTVPSDTRSDTCLPAVPGVRIGCFTPDPATTRGEARYIGRLAKAYHWHSVVIVTTPVHAWRARLRVERCFPGRVFVATSPLPAMDWVWQVPYQWVASIKAETLQRAC